MSMRIDAYRWALRQEKNQRFFPSTCDKSIVLTGSVYFWSFSFSPFFDQSARFTLRVCTRAPMHINGCSSTPRQEEIRDFSFHMRQNVSFCRWFWLLITFLFLAIHAVKRVSSDLVHYRRGIEKDSRARDVVFSVS